MTTRREFIGLLGGAAAVWPPVTRAEQPERMRRIGILMNLAADDAVAQARLAAFLQGLQQLGWTDGDNVRIDYRWAAGHADRFQRYAEELLALAPDVILASAAPSVQALQRATRSVPIVFANVSDPVASGFVQSLARPGGNTTGFIQFEFGLSGKWLELLKQVAPEVTRAAVLRDPDVGTGTDLGSRASQQKVTTHVRVGSCVTSIAGPNGMRNCTRDEGGPFGFGDQEPIPSHRKLLLSKATVVNVAETSGR